MSEFLSGSVLAERIKTMIQEQQQITIATAFIGDGFDDLIRARPKTFPPVTVYCDLTMGGTNPAPLKSLLKNAPGRIILKSCGGLHAKVILGRQRAIVSSANLSRNALGDMAPNSTDGPKLQEAGMYLSSADDGLELAKIRAWFADLSARNITEHDDWQLKEAQAAFSARAKLARPAPRAPRGDDVPTVLATLTDRDNRPFFKRCLVVVTTTSESGPARKLIKDMQTKGFPVNDEEFFEDRDEFGEDNGIAWFVGSRKNDDLKFSGYYVMRDDTWAVVSHPDGAKPFWMQFVERDKRGAWLPSDPASKAEFTRLVSATVKRTNTQRKSCQFQLLDLLKAK